MANPVGVGIEFFTTFQSAGVNAARDSIFHLTDSMTTLSYAANGLSLTFDKFTKVLIGGLAQAASDMIELEKNFFNMARIIGDGGASGAVRILEEDLIALSKVVPVSSKVIANLGAETAQLGIATENVAATIETSVKAAEALGLNVESVVTKMGKIANLFEIQGDQFPDFVNRFSSATVDLANTTVATGDNIIEMTRKLASYRAITGASAQETIALSAVLSSMGGEVATSATAMSILFSEMQEQTSKYAEVAGTTEEAFLKMSASDRLEKFFKGMKKVASQGEGALAPMMKDLGIARSQVKRSVLNLMKAFTGGVDPAIQYRNVLDRANKSMAEGTSLNTAFGKVMGTTENKLQITKNTLENMRIGAVQPFNDVLKPLIDILNVILSALDAIPNSIKAIVVIVGVLTASLSGLLAVTAAAGTAIVALGLALFNLRRQFFDFSPAHFMSGFKDTYADFSNFFLKKAFSGIEALGASTSSVMKRLILSAGSLQSGIVGRIQKSIAGVGVDLRELQRMAQKSIRAQIERKYGPTTDPAVSAFRDMMARRRAASMAARDPFKLLMFGDFKTNIQALRVAFAQLTPFILKVTKYLIMWPVIILSTVAALKSANGVVKAFGLAVLAVLSYFYPIAAAIVVVLAYWTELTQIAKQFVAGVKITSSIINTIGKSAGNLSNKFNVAIGEAGKALMKGLMDISLFLGKLIGQIIDILGPFVLILGSVNIGLFATVIDGATLALQIIGDLVSSIAELFNLSSVFNEKDTGAGSFIQSMISIVALFASLASGLFAVWAILKLVAGFASGLVEGIRDGVNYLKGTLEGISKWFDSFLPEEWRVDGGFIESLKELASQIGSGLRTIGNAVGFLLSFLVVPLTIIIKSVTTLLRLLGAVFGAFVKIKEFIFGSSFLHIAEGLKVIHKSVRKDLISPLETVKNTAKTTKTAVNRMMETVDRQNELLAGSIGAAGVGASIVQSSTTSTTVGSPDFSGLPALIAASVSSAIATTTAPTKPEVEKAVEASKRSENTTMTIYLTLPDEKVLAEAVIDYTNEELMRSGGQLSFGRKMLSLRGR